MRLLEDGFHRQRLEEHPAISYVIACLTKQLGISVNYEALAFYRVFIELKMVVVILTGIKSYFGTGASPTELYGLAERRHGHPHAGRSQ